MDNRVQNLINFEEYGFKPSAVIEALNKWYERYGGTGILFKIELPNPKEGARKYHAFYDHDKAIDDAIKYLRSMDIFYQPGLKWDDVKYKLSDKACIRELGYSCVADAWPKVNPCFVGPRTERENEIRDYILKRADANDIKVPESFRDQSASVEDLMSYLLDLLTKECEDKKLIKIENGIQVTERENKIRNYILRHAEDEDIAIPKSLKDPRLSVENLIAYLFAVLIQARKNKELAEKIRDQYRERADGYLEKIDRLQKELDNWDCWYNDKEQYVK